MNPALTLGMATVGKLPWRKLPAYWIGQYLVNIILSLFTFESINKLNHICWILSPKRSAVHCNDYSILDELDNRYDTIIIIIAFLL